MALEYLKLANLSAMIDDAEITRATLLAGMADETIKVVNLKGRMLTAEEIGKHLDGTLDAETVTR